MSLRSVVAPLDEAAVAQVLDQSPDTLFALESFFDLSSERLAVVFDALDSSGDGMLSRDELLAGLSTVGVFYRSIDDPDFPAAGDDSTIDKQTFEAILRRAKLEALFKHAHAPVPKPLPSMARSLSRRATAGSMGDEVCLATVRFTVHEYDKRSYATPWGEHIGDEETYEFFMAPPLAAAAGTVRWINMDGLHELTLMRLAARYALHPLALEDALHVESRPKVEFYDSGVFIVMPMLKCTQQAVDRPQGRRSWWAWATCRDTGGLLPHVAAGDESMGKLHIEAETISIFIQKAERTVITIQEKAGDVWHQLRKQMTRPYSKVRMNDHNFLAYSLMDDITDCLFPVLDQVQRELSRLEHSLQQDDGGRGVASFDVAAVHHLKSELAFMHRMLRPMRAVLHSIIESKDVFAHGSTKAHWRDVESHLCQVLEEVEVGVEQCRDLTEHYEVKRNNRQAQVIYVLTIATILIIPAQLFSGVYGMNFAAPAMPELSYRYGYTMFWVVALVSPVLLLASFRRMGWL